MALFYYRGKNLAGEKISGVLEADNKYHVAKIIKGKGYFPIAIKEHNPARLFRPISHKKHLKDLSIFCRQLSVLEDTGVPIVESLEIIRKQTENKRFRYVIDNLIKGVVNGLSLAEVCRHYPKFFPEVFVYSVEAGELSSNLSRVLKKLSTYYEGLAVQREKTKNIFLYPIILCIVTFFVTAFLVIRVLPKLAEMLKDAGAHIPTSTKLLLFISVNFTKFITLFCIVAILATTSLFSIRLSETWMLFLHKSKLSLPVLGSLEKKRLAARICQGLSLLLESGIPIIKSLEVISKTVENQHIMRNLECAITGLRQGKYLNELLDEAVFPSMMVKMVAVGEETGSLSEILDKVAIFYEKEVDLVQERLLSLVEPIIIVFIAGFIAFIIISIMIPMMNVYQLY